MNEWWEEIVKVSDEQILKIHIKDTWMTGTVHIYRPTGANGLAVTITENSLWNGGAPWSLSLIKSRKTTPAQWSSFLVGKEITSEIDIEGAMTADRAEYTSEAEEFGIAEGTPIPIERVGNRGVESMKGWITEMYDKYWGVKGQNRWFDEKPKKDKKTPDTADLNIQELQQGQGLGLRESWTGQVKQK